MNPIDILLHLANLLLPAVGVGVIAPALAKLLWRRELAGVAYGRLVLWCIGAGAVVVVAGLVVLGRDGRMATYLTLVVVAAVALWWAGFGPGRRAGR
jgi:hypothetical protein